MSTSGVVLILLGVYFALNFTCALALHIHGERAVHPHLRWMEVLVHFVLMTAFAIPILLVVMAQALFGGKEPVQSNAVKVPAAKAA